MKKLIVIGWLLLGASPLFCAEDDLLARRAARKAKAAENVRMQLRVAAFNDWKKDPEIKKRLDADEPGTIQAYIHLTMFLREPEEKAKSPEYIAEAGQLAQQICPSYAYWPEYYEVYSRCKRGKACTHEENMELAVAPKVAEIMRLKMMRALLKRENPHLVATKPDWKKEVELAGIKKEDSRSLMALISRVLPAKNNELDQLKKEIDECSTVENLEKTLVHEKQLWAANDELATVTGRLQDLRAKFDERTNADGKTIVEQGKNLKVLEDAANEQRVAFERKQNELNAKQFEIAQLQEIAAQIGQEKEKLQSRCKILKIA